MSHERLMKADYRSIRPAFGYPACPDHGDKRSSCEYPRCEIHGFKLTESMLLILLQVFRVILRSPGSEILRYQPNR